MRLFVFLCFLAISVCANVYLESGLDPNWTFSDTGDFSYFKAHASFSLEQLLNTARLKYKDYTPNSRILFEVNELYAEKTISDTWSFSVGRQVLDWSYIDRVWYLGVVNNRKNFDLFYADAVGLSVAKVTKRYNDLEISVIGSYLNIPERYPYYEDGKKGRVAVYPTLKHEVYRYANIFGKPIPLYYSIKDVNLSKALFRPTYGISLKYNLDKSYAQAYYIKKPENQYKPDLNAFFDLSKKTIFVDVLPDFFEHEIVGGDLVLAFNTFNFYISGVQDYPEDKTPEKVNYGFEILQNRYKSLRVSTGLEKNFEKTKLGVSVMRETFKKELYESILVSGSAYWGTAIALYLNNFWTDKFNTLTDIRFRSSDVLLSFHNQYRLLKNIGVGGGIQIVNINSHNFYWAAYRNQTTIYTTLFYLF